MVDCDCDGQVPCDRCPSYRPEPIFADNPLEGRYAFQEHLDAIRSEGRPHSAHSTFDHINKGVQGSGACQRGRKCVL